MKTHKLISLFFCLATMICKAQIQDAVRINEREIKTSKEQVYDRINRISGYMTDEEGKPELPFYRVSYVLPIEAKVIIQLSGVHFKPL